MKIGSAKYNAIINFCELKEPWKINKTVVLQVYLSLELKLLATM